MIHTVALRLGVAAVLVTVQVVHSLPLVGSVLDRAVDTILGPEDDFDYVSTTQPATPPPLP